MISVVNLKKNFGRTQALQDISFYVPKGSVVGLVGNNGAGKTTLIRILAGLLAPSDGTATIGGLDVVWDSLEARGKIGYLSEQVPLYTDMRVKEFLKFRAALKGVPRPRRRERIRQVVQACGLQGMDRKFISALSRGFQKRVGLADALVHMPDVLILDEPTLALDPSHAESIRILLKGLAGRHTALFSTHSRAEAEAVASQVLVLEQGRLVAAEKDPPAPQRSLFEVELQGPVDVILARFRSLPRARLVEHREAGGWLRLVLEGEPQLDLRGEIYATVAENGWTLRALGRVPEGATLAARELTGERVMP